MLNHILTLLETIARLLVSDPLTAADRLDELAVVLKEQAEKIRVAYKGHAPTSPSGLGDSCRMKVAGPDGVIKQDTYIKG